MIISIITIWAFLFNTFGMELAWASKTPSPVLPASGTGNAGSPGHTILPKELGEIKEVHTGVNKKTVIYIQEAHCNYSCQKSIRDIIEHFNHKRGVDLALLEGGAGDYDLSIFTKIEEKALREKTAGYFLKEGRINGAEFFAINNPRKIALKGLEKPELYKKNLKIYRDSLKQKDEIDDIISTLSRYLSNLRDHIYPERLREFEEKKAAYDNTELGLGEYLDYIAALSSRLKIKISKHKNLNNLLQAKKIEDGIDFKTANYERGELINELQKRLPQAELENLIKNSSLFKEGALREIDFYSYLFRKAGTVTIDVDKRYPDLSSYKKYKEILESIQEEALFSDIEKQEGEIIERLCRKKSQKKLYLLSKNLSLLKDFFNISLTSEKYGYYRKNKRRFRISRFQEFIKRNAPRYNIKIDFPKKITLLDRYRKEFERFYEYAFKRDRAFIENITRHCGEDEEERSLIVVTGGFHTMNLREYLRDEGYSYIVILPRFNPGEETSYFKLLSGGLSPIEEEIRTRTSSIPIPGAFCEQIGGEPISAKAVEVVKARIAAEAVKTKRKEEKAHKKGRQLFGRTTVLAALYTALTFVGGFAGEYIYYCYMLIRTRFPEEENAAVLPEERAKAGPTDASGAAPEEKTLPLDDLTIEKIPDQKFPWIFYLKAILNNRNLGRAEYSLVNPDHLHLLDMRSGIKRQGIGQRLMERVKTEACMAGRSKITLEVTETNTKAIAFYEEMARRLNMGIDMETFKDYSPNWVDITFTITDSEEVLARVEALKAPKTDTTDASGAAPGDSSKTVIIEKPSTEGILRAYRNLPAETVYSAPVANDRQIKRLWHNRERIEFGVILVPYESGPRLVITQGDEGSFVVLEDIDKELIETHTIPFLIHNHPQHDKKPIRNRREYLSFNIDAAEKWFTLEYYCRGIPSPFPSGFGVNCSDFDLIKRLPTVQEFYVYTKEFGYVLYGVDPQEERRCGHVKMEAWQDGEYQVKEVYDDGALFSWGISYLEPQTFDVFKEFVEAIEEGAEKIRLTGFRGRYAEWNSQVNFDTILKEAGFKPKEQIATTDASGAAPWERSIDPRSVVFKRRIDEAVESRYFDDVFGERVEVESVTVVGDIHSYQRFRDFKNVLVLDASTKRPEKRIITGRIEYFALCDEGIKKESEEFDIEIPAERAFDIKYIAEQIDQKGIGVIVALLRRETLIVDSTKLITFSSKSGKKRIIYKAFDTVALEAKIMTLLKRLGYPTISFDVRPPDDFGRFAWMEHVEHIPLESQEAGRHFKKRHAHQFGRWLAIDYILGLFDSHTQNFFLGREDPDILFGHDLETVLDEDIMPLEDFVAEIFRFVEALSKIRKNVLYLKRFIADKSITEGIAAALMQLLNRDTIGYIITFIQRETTGLMRRQVLRDTSDYRTDPRLEGIVPFYAIDVTEDHCIGMGLRINNLLNDFASPSKYPPASPPPTGDTTTDASGAAPEEKSAQGPDIKIPPEEIKRGLYDDNDLSMTYISGGLAGAFLTCAEALDIQFKKPANEFWLTLIASARVVQNLEELLFEKVRRRDEMGFRNLPNLALLVRHIINPSLDNASPREQMLWIIFNRLGEFISLFEVFSSDSERTTPEEMKLTSPMLNLEGQAEVIEYYREEVAEFILAILRVAGERRLFIERPPFIVEIGATTGRTSRLYMDRVREMFPNARYVGTDTFRPRGLALPENEFMLHNILESPLPLDEKPDIIVFTNVDMHLSPGEGGGREAAWRNIAASTKPWTVILGGSAYFKDHRYIRLGNEIVKIQTAEDFAEAIDSIHPPHAEPPEAGPTDPSGAAPESVRDVDTFAKPVIVFPSPVDAQVGMGRELYDNHAEARKIYDHARKILGYDNVSRLFLREEDRSRRDIVAICTILYSVAMYEVFSEETRRRMTPLAFAGDSLGAITAGIVSGSVSLEDILPFMQALGSSTIIDSAPDYQIIVVSNVNREAIAKLFSRGEVELLQDASLKDASGGSLALAVMNGDNIAAIEKELSAMGARILSIREPRIKSTHLSYCELLMGQIVKLRDAVAVHEPAIPIISSKTGEWLTTAAECRAYLANTPFGPVLWRDVIEEALHRGATSFIAFGSCLTLAAMTRPLTSGAVRTLRVNDSTRLRGAASSFDKRHGGAKTTTHVERGEPIRAIIPAESETGGVRWVPEVRVLPDGSAEEDSPQRIKFIRRLNEERRANYAGIARYDGREYFAKMLSEKYSRHDGYTSAYNYTCTRPQAGILEFLRSQGVHGINEAEHFLELEDGRKVILLEKLGGKTLRQVISEEESLPDEKACDIMLKISNIVKSLLSLRVYHWDIKPGNMIMDPDVEDVTVTDFDLSFRTEDDFRLRRMYRSGTEQYTSKRRYGYIFLGHEPGDIPFSHSDEIFSLGMIFAEMLGAQIDESDTPVPAEIRARSIIDQITGNGNIPEGIQLVIRNALCGTGKSYGESAYQTIDEFIRAIKEATPPQSTTDASGAAPEDDDRSQASIHRETMLDEIADYVVGKVRLENLMAVRRLFERLLVYLSIESTTKAEEMLRERLMTELRQPEIGAQDVRVDSVGNCIAELEATAEGLPTILLSAHMDVHRTPGAHCIYSKGRLEGRLRDERAQVGLDNRVGVAAVMETLRVIQESGMPHGKIRILFTVDEEGGHRGVIRACEDGILEGVDYVFTFDYMRPMPEELPAAIVHYAAPNGHVGSIISSAAGHLDIDYVADTGRKIEGFEHLNMRHGTGDADSLSQVVESTFDFCSGVGYVGTPHEFLDIPVYLRQIDLLIAVLKEIYISSSGEEEPPTTPTDPSGAAPEESSSPKDDMGKKTKEKSMILPPDRAIARSYRVWPGQEFE
ncbi:MAG: M20/M25/M40 family metallo-hydrolase, partial [Candidatus Omnitrophica bacterium]|nr:M20/M25/M40 family metallo-hydrolase [Candidatus Omnitrophota bacterium]